MKTEPQSIHDDFLLDDSFWESRDFIVGESDGRFRVYRNYLRDGSRRYDGYLVFDTLEPATTRQYHTVKTASQAALIAVMLKDREN